MGRKNKSSKQENNNNVARYVKINFDDNERFIKTITFDRSKDEKTWWEEKEWFYPFKEGTKICFNDWMKEILEFYFKNKDWFNKEKADSVVEKMKINVIVWENGTGKSRLLGKIYQYIYNKEKENEEKGQKDVFLDSIALFDYLRTKKSEWGAKKENISQEITKFMEISKWSHNKWILDRYLRFIVLYVVLLRRFKLNDILWPVVIGKNLKELKFKIGNVDLVEKFEKCLTNRKWEHFWKCIDKSLNKLFELDNIESRDIFSDNINLLLRLSSWQNSLLIRFSMILSFILSRIYEKTNKNKKSFIILIDEPDLHLHLDWQRQYIHKLIDVFWRLLSQKEFKNIYLHFIIATHSPFILSDVPGENVILLEKVKDEKWNFYTKVTDWWGRTFDCYDEKKFNKDFVLKKIELLKGILKGSTFNRFRKLFEDPEKEKKNKSNKKYSYDDLKKKIKSFKNEDDNVSDEDYCILIRRLNDNFLDKPRNDWSFGANFIDLIKNWFFFQTKYLMGSFAEEVINQIAECERKKVYLESLKFQLEYKKFEKKNIEGLKKKIESLKEKEIFNELKKESKNILISILKEADTSWVNKNELMNLLEKNFKKRIKELKKRWIDAKEKIINWEIKDIESYIEKIQKEIKVCENDIKQKIWDSFLRNNLLYFKKSNAKDKNKK